MRASLRSAAALLLACAAPAAAAQEKPARNDPSQCPYCRNDPAVLAGAGLVSHGPFEFGKTPNDSRTVDDQLVSDIYWIETPHLEIGLGLGPYRVTQKEKEEFRAELTELQRVLPEVDPKTKVIDEWLRLHLYAARCEAAYRRFLELVQKTEADFPKPGEQWLLGTPFRGTGPYLGMAGKYEVLLLATEAEHVAFLNEQFGLTIPRTQRWHVVDRETVDVTIHLEQGSLKIDKALHGHLVFSLAHNFFDGFRHYSYDTPVWLHEGLAHCMEREISPRYNTFDAAEGAPAAETRKEAWIPEARKLAQSGTAPRMAELINLQSYAALTLDIHFTTWSMVDYLIREQPDGLACLLSALKGRVTKEGMPDGGNLRDAHRDAFQTCLGMSYAEFDQAWAAWIGTQVERKD
jgi:hypothetical protein